MIEKSKLKSSKFDDIFINVEESNIDELENLLVSRLMSKKTVNLSGESDEVIEFAGRTNFKIRLKRPNKNVWSISNQDFRESIRKVLRKGELEDLNDNRIDSRKSHKEFDLPTLMLLHVLPDEEYQNRSFIGNTVIHPTLGEGKVVRISETGNVEVKFAERVVMLKPNFIELKIC